eukprot:gene8710-34456_t
MAVSRRGVISMLHDVMGSVCLADFRLKHACCVEHGVPSARARAPGTGMPPAGSNQQLATLSVVSPPWACIRVRALLLSAFAAKADGKEKMAISAPVDSRSP